MLESTLNQQLQPNKSQPILGSKVLLNCGILEAYWDVDFDDFYGSEGKKSELLPKIQAWNTKYPDFKINLDFDEGKRILDDVLLYANNLDRAKKHGISLFLQGPNGTGKTLLGVCVLKAAIRLGYSAQMTSLGGIIETYTEGWTNDEQREAFNKRIKNVDFLLIDDVGKEYRAKNNDLVEVAFDNLIRYRTMRRKPFILTTNTDIDRLKSTYGKSLASLLTGRCFKVEVSGVDYRLVVQAKDIRKQLKEG